MQNTMTLNNGTVVPYALARAVIEMVAYPYAAIDLVMLVYGEKTRSEARAMAEEMQSRVYEL